MKLTNIKEAGNNNILRFAINRGADIRNDIGLLNIINTETFYLITMEDVNLLELFKLVQSYRNKIKIVQEYKADIPPISKLSQSFTGSTTVDNKEVNYIDIVQTSCESFMNIMSQMLSDDDIIKPGTARLFIPMICRRFTVQIPISFADFVRSFDEKFDMSKVFNDNYPNNLYETCIDPGNDVFRGLIEFAMMRSTTITKPNNHYDSLLKLIKYNSLIKEETNKLYKTKLLGFNRYNPASRDEVRCTMFNTSKQLLEDGMKRMSGLSTPIKFDFAIQLPLEYMNMLQNSYSHEELPITYETSITETIGEGLKFNDFITPELSNEEDESKIEEFNNQIKAYQTRIGETSLVTMNSISLLVNDPDHNDITSSFALLPSIFTTRAVITVDSSKINTFTKETDPLLAEMFNDIKTIIDSITTDITSRK